MIPCHQTNPHKPSSVVALHAKAMRPLRTVILPLNIHTAACPIYVSMMAPLTGGPRSAPRPAIAIHTHADICANVLQLFGAGRKGCRQPPKRSLRPQHPGMQRWVLFQYNSFEMTMFPQPCALKTFESQPVSSEPRNSFTSSILDVLNEDDFKTATSPEVISESISEEYQCVYRRLRGGVVLPPVRGRYLGTLCQAARTFHLNHFFRPRYNTKFHGVTTPPKW